MSNRFRLKRKKVAGAQRKRCPKCGTKCRSKEYSDAWLHICTNSRCQFPVREPKR